MRERLEAVSGSAALRLRPVLPGQGLTSEIRKNLPGRALLASRPLLNRQEHVVIQIYRGAHASDATTSRWHAGGLRLGRNLRAAAEGRQTERPSSSISDAAPHQLVRPSTSSLPQRSWTHKIEHRLFSYITMNWRGKPLVSLETIVNLIAGTTTRTGLEVYARLDTGTSNLRALTPTGPWAPLGA